MNVTQILHKRADLIPRRLCVLSLGRRPYHLYERLNRVVVQPLLRAETPVCTDSIKISPWFNLPTLFY